MKRSVFFVISAALFYLIQAAFPPYAGFEKIKNDDPKAVQIYYENKMHRAGILWLSINNSGAIGNPGWSMMDYCTDKPAASAEMPAGSSKEYVYLGNLWAGGYTRDSLIYIDNAEAGVFGHPTVSTSVFESWSEMQPYAFDDDPKGLVQGRINESSNVQGRMNCMFEDVYDPTATAYEQFSTMFTDKLGERFYNYYDQRWHIPLGLEIKQTSYAWPYNYSKKFIIIDYTIYNRNNEQKDIYDFFMGLFVDSDVKDISLYQDPVEGYLDDICGFIDKWDGYVDPATGETKTVELNLAWTADNDGREYIHPSEGSLTIYEPGAGTLLNGATGIFSLRVLRNPNPNLRYSFNHWVWGLNESTDWGPRWKTGYHSDWQYDLSPDQKGYDDTNYDDLTNWEGSPLVSGRTEGTPVDDIGKYMLMSNDEFDYNQTAIREVYLGLSSQSDGTPIPQVGQWQPWIVSGEEEPGELADGALSDLNEIANGRDARFLLSFGPLGMETHENVGINSDQDSLGTIDGIIPNKKMWKFAYGDSLKLTVAIIVSENFHTSTDQDPNYSDDSIVDIHDGLDVSLYDQGWYDAFYNVVWAERLFDTPMYDTPVKRLGAEKKDGWYGEDIGADAVFGDLSGDRLCWWNETFYQFPDEGEGDFELTDFTQPFYDTYGDYVTNEDDLLKYGRQTETSDYGITGSLDNGEGYGYMVKYQKSDGSVPQGSWVRYGFDNDRLDAGDGVPDFIAPPPPPPPKVKITALDDEIILEWCSHEFFTDPQGNTGATGPEQVYDPFTRLYDFESYNIEVSDDMKNYTTIFSVDKVNYSYQNVADVTDYLENPIPADTLEAHPEDYPAMKTANNKIYRLVPFGDNCDLSLDHEEEAMYTYNCISAISPYAEWDVIRYYKFILHKQLIGQKKYISVTAGDFGAPKMGVPPQKSEPSSNAQTIVTSKLSGEDVIVVPNPYRGDANYTDMGWEDIDGQYIYAEEYRKIAFLNIPERCVIKIYTLSGDLVKTIAHNGYSEADTPYWYGKNGAYWNLINENHQAVTSGLYLFSIEDVDKKKDDFVGKFVIIK